MRCATVSTETSASVPHPIFSYAVFVGHRPDFSLLLTVVNQTLAHHCLWPSSMSGKLAALGVRFDRKASDVIDFQTNLQSLDGFPSLANINALTPGGPTIGSTAQQGWHTPILLIAQAGTWGRCFGELFSTPRSSIAANSRRTLGPQLAWPSLAPNRRGDADTLRLKSKAAHSTVESFAQSFSVEEKARQASALRLQIIRSSGQRQR